MAEMAHQRHALPLAAAEPFVPTFTLSLFPPFILQQARERRVWNLERSSLSSFQGLTPTVAPAPGVYVGYSDGAGGSLRVFPSVTRTRLGWLSTTWDAPRSQEDPNTISIEGWNDCLSLLRSAYGTIYVQILIMLYVSSANGQDALPFELAEAFPPLLVLSMTAAATDIRNVLLALNDTLSLASTKSSVAEHASLMRRSTHGSGVNHRERVNLTQSYQILPMSGMSDTI
ncbi:hypothetical protein B0J12DRAFT_695901 [Macrophomina phaseolina]|uniref:Uncharacterized protein n=1 Tax=Macrophomina phaseolina TaxID=35725 RepID=A0ABQ8GM57_9PEZI|nr:hypothetical protein B0J12DRAFT_695901 [Macrophomina phaseolina]